MLMWFMSLPSKASERLHLLLWQLGVIIIANDVFVLGRQCKAMSFPKILNQMIFKV